MRSFVVPVVAALGIGSLAISVAAVSSGAVMAQAAKQAPAKQAEPAPAAAPAEMPAPKQIALTEKQIESVLAAQKDLDAVTAKLPEQATAKPDPKVIAQLDDVAKKYGFADYADYNIVIDNVSLVLAGFDPKTKAYVGPDAVIKSQIAAVQADKKMLAKDKKEALADLNTALKTLPPAIENKANIDLVAKYYGRLFAAMQEDE